MMILPVGRVESEQSLPRNKQDRTLDELQPWRSSHRYTRTQVSPPPPHTRVEGAYVVLGHAFGYFGSVYMASHGTSHASCMSQLLV